MTKQQLPAIVKTFNFHGANYVETPNDWLGDCLFCGKEKHSYLNIKYGLWNCKVCGEGGNVKSFITKLAQKYTGKALESEWTKLAGSRGIPSEILKWAGFYFREGAWWLPCSSPTGHILDIRKYNATGFLSTAGCDSQLWGAVRLASDNRNTVHHCEGEWDGMAMYWLLNELGLSDTDSVVAVPGAGTFKDAWVELYARKNVIFYYDRDKAGDEGAVRAYKKIKAVAKSIKFVNWPLTKPDGYDLRDFVCKEGLLVDKPAKTIWAELISLQEPLPLLLKSSNDGETKKANAGDEPIELEEVISIFSKSIRMNEDMEIGLKLMLATCMSNDLSGDPLWMYIVGPPGAGKTLLLVSLATSLRCIFRSTLTAHSLISGWRQEGGADPSLIPKLKGLTFVTKDFTEILTMPPFIQDEIFSTLRGAYDGTASKAFGNGVTREYADCHFSMLAGVTHAIHGHKRASLGERFLKFGIRANDDQAANETIAAAISGVGHEKAIEESLQAACNRFLQKRMDPKSLPTLPQAYQDRLTALVQLIAIMRANVERDQRTQEITYRPVPEAGTRLAKQLVKCAICLAFIHNKKEVDENVYKLVERVAYDTAHGFGLDTLSAMLEMGGVASRVEVGKVAKIPTSTLHRQFDDLIMLKAIEKTNDVRIGGLDGGRPASLFKVNKNLVKLWERAKGIQLCGVKKNKLSLRSKPKLVLKPQKG